jgi:hypothetical protein
MLTGRLSRRALMLTSLSLAVAGVVSRLRAATCAAPAGDEAGLRAELHYAATTSDPAKPCSACSFFSQSHDSCGTCQILSGPVSPNGHCDSWAHA